MRFRGLITSPDRMARVEAFTRLVVVLPWSSVMTAFTFCRFGLNVRRLMPVVMHLLMRVVYALFVMA